VQDIAALIAVEGGPLECLVAHDWGGAVAWLLANKLPHLAKKLVIINSPHPGTFLRELKTSPKQQAASAYMNFLIRPDSEKLLREDNYRRMWSFFVGPGGAAWLTPSVKQQYQEVWDASLEGGCNYYRASPLRPARPEDPAAAAIELPREMLTVNIPTLVLWAMNDTALLPELVDGLGDYIPDLTLEKVEGATHWIVHERPQFVAQRIAAFLQR
jgi:pimeloyl-ACP methyl ester carboxylesterase